jgi:hypothetical protein
MIENALREAQGNNGTVLVAGGADVNFAALGSAELYQ